MAPSKAELASLQRAAEEADAAALIQNLEVTRQDDVLTADVKGAVKGIDQRIKTAATKSTNGADTYVTLYHAYDGRTRAVPMYMAPRYMTTRFDVFDNDIPEEWRGKAVWSIDPLYPAPDDRPHDFQCRLSKTNTDPEVVAEMKAAGLAMTCRKQVAGGGFTNQFEADEHFRKKHPRRWEAYQRYVSRAGIARGADAQTMSAEAMAAALKMMQAFMEQQAAASKTKE